MARLGMVENANSGFPVTLTFVTLAVVSFRAGNTSQLPFAAYLLPIKRCHATPAEGPRMRSFLTIQTLHETLAKKVTLVVKSSSQQRLAPPLFIGLGSFANEIRHGYPTETQQP